MNLTSKSSRGNPEFINVNIAHPNKLVFWKKENSLCSNTLERVEWKKYISNKTK